MVIKCIYRIYMYKPLLVNVSVSLIVSGVQPHMKVCFESNNWSVLVPYWIVGFILNHIIHEL